MKTHLRLVEYLVAIPIATLIAVFDRYGSGDLVPNFAWPMVVILNSAFVISALVLNLRRRDEYRDLAWVTLGTLAISFLVAFSILTGFRLYFSLGYSATYVIIAVLWVMLINQIHRDEFTTARLALAKVGDWQLLAKTNSIEIVEGTDDLKSKHLDGLIIDYHVDLSDSWKSAIAMFSLEQKPVYHVASFFEMINERIALSHISDEFIFAPPRSSYTILKRPLDILISLLLLTMLALPLGIILLMVKVTSSGPAIFRQPRIGLNGDVFTLYKVRTMRDNGQVPGVAFTTADDPRITWIGKFLRALRIDEWPQFWNVIKGDMSLVGPRPEQPYWVEHFREAIPFYDLRHAVRPGISGWAQIKQGYASGVNESTTKLEYDLYYIKNLGPSLDLRIALKTLYVLARQSGAK